MRSVGKYLTLFTFVALAAISLFGLQPLDLSTSKASTEATPNVSPATDKPNNLSPDASTSTQTTEKQEQSDQARLKDSYGKLPMSFEPNQGQTDEKIKFFAHGRGYNLYLTPAEAVLVLGKSSARASDKNRQEDNEKSGGERRPKKVLAVLRIKLRNANDQAPMHGLEEQPGKSNYYIGNDPRKWQPEYQTIQVYGRKISIRA